MEQEQLNLFVDMSYYVAQNKEISFKDFCALCEQKYTVEKLKEILKTIFSDFYKDDCSLQLLYPVLVMFDDYYKFGNFESLYEIINNENFTYIILDELYLSKPMIRKEPIIKKLGEIIHTYDKNKEFIKCMDDVKKASEYIKDSSNKFKGLDQTNITTKDYYNLMMTCKRGNGTAAPPIMSGIMGIENTKFDYVKMVDDFTKNKHFTKDNYAKLLNWLVLIGDNAENTKITFSISRKDKGNAQQNK